MPGISGERCAGMWVSPTNLAAHLLDAAHVFVEPLREWGAYAPALQVNEGSGRVGQLLAFVGHDPKWPAIQG